MRKVFTLTKLQYAVLLIASKPVALQIPYKKRIISVHHQRAVNAIWKYFGYTMGFLPTKVNHLSSHGKYQFSATCGPMTMFKELNV